MILSAYKLRTYMRIFHLVYCKMTQSEYDFVNTMKGVSFYDRLKGVNICMKREEIRVWLDVEVRKKELLPRAVCSGITSNGLQISEVHTLDTPLH